MPGLKRNPIYIPPDEDDPRRKKPQFRIEGPPPPPVGPNYQEAQQNEIKIEGPFKWQTSLGTPIRRNFNKLSPSSQRSLLGGIRSTAATADDNVIAEKQLRRSMNVPQSSGQGSPAGGATPARMQIQAPPAPPPPPPAETPGKKGSALPDFATWARQFHPELEHLGRKGTLQEFEEIWGQYTSFIQTEATRLEADLSTQRVGLQRRRLDLEQGAEAGTGIGAIRPRDVPATLAAQLGLAILAAGGDPSPQDQAVIDSLREVLKQTLKNPGNSLSPLDQARQEAFDAMKQAPAHANLSELAAVKRLQIINNSGATRGAFDRDLKEQLYEELREINVAPPKRRWQVIADKLRWIVPLMAGLSDTERMRAMQSVRLEIPSLQDIDNARRDRKISPEEAVTLEGLVTQLERIAAQSAAPQQGAAPGGIRQISPEVMRIKRAYDAGQLDAATAQHQIQAQLRREAGGG